MKQHTTHNGRVFRAYKIDTIHPAPDTGTILKLEGGIIEWVSIDYMEANQPEQGGYYIKYDGDGYEGYMSAEDYFRQHGPNFRYSPLEIQTRIDWLTVEYQQILRWFASEYNTSSDPEGVFNQHIRCTELHTEIKVLKDLIQAK